MGEVAKARANVERVLGFGPASRHVGMTREVASVTIVLLWRRCEDKHPRPRPQAP